MLVSERDFLVLGISEVQVQLPPRKKTGGGKREGVGMELVVA